MIDPALNILSDKILDYIRRKPGHFHDVRSLAKKFKSRKADILFATDLLRESGYKIEARNIESFAFIEAPDLLLAAELGYRIKTRYIGKKIYAYKIVQSTNTIAARLAEAGAPEGTVIVAETQTRGRGRMGRSWYSPPGSGIYLSIILYPQIDPLLAPGLSIISAVALADVLASYKGLNPEIKWPNDCLINGRKTAGILTELAGEPGKVHYVVVGVGINANQRASDFPEDMRRRATSVGRELKKNIRRVEITQNFLKSFEGIYNRFKKSGLKPIRKKVIGYSRLIGNRVRLDMRGKIISGKAVDIDEAGHLVLETSDGRQKFNAGEVTVVKNRN